MLFGNMKQQRENNDADDIIAEAIAKMDELNAWDFEAKVKQILGKLNIHHLQQHVSDIKRRPAKTCGTC